MKFINYIVNYIYFLYVINIFAAEIKNDKINFMSDLIEKYTDINYIYCYIQTKYTYLLKNHKLNRVSLTIIIIKYGLFILFTFK